MEIIFTRVRSFLRESGPRGWTKGHTQTVHADGTISYCLGGLIEIVGGGSYRMNTNETADAIQRAARQLAGVLTTRGVDIHADGCCVACSGVTPPIPAMNDMATTTFQDILTTVERLAAEDEEHMITTAPAVAAPTTQVEQPAAELAAV